jgi:hypothetical protein
MRSLTSLVATAAACAATVEIADGQRIENSDIYVSATELADEVELIRETMGRPFDDSARLPVSGVTLDELYFQTETLLMKTGRLATELAGADPVALPPIPGAGVTTGQILALVDRSLQSIDLVRGELGIVEQVRREERDTPIAPTGVFSVVLDTNRQLNLLLDATVTSADVYERLAVAATYAAGLLEARGPGARPGAEHLGPKLPADVYRTLLECIELVTEVGNEAGVEMLTLSSRRNVPDDITPGHVYDVAQFLLADLALLARSVGAAPGAVDLGQVPRHVFPSHTFQLADLLQRQLEALAAEP